MAGSRSPSVQLRPRSLVRLLRDLEPAPDGVTDCLDLRRFGEDLGAGDHVGLAFVAGLSQDPVQVIPQEGG